MELFGRNIWDLSLTYGHFNLHDSRFFFNAPYSLSNHDSSVSSCSYATYCQDRSMLLLAAAPLSMGLLTHQGPPEWHPAPIELKQACQEAAALCSEYGIDFACLALLFALCNSQIPCTLLGLSCVDEIKTAHAIALRLKGLSTPNLSHDEMLDAVLNPIERVVLGKLRDTETGPFASVWKLGLFQWDGVQLAHEFWKPLVNQATEKWQAPS